MGKQDPEGEMKYLKLCMLSAVEEEDEFHKCLEPMRSKFHLSEEDFQQQIITYANTPGKAEQIMSVK